MFLFEFIVQTEENLQTTNAETHSDWLVKEN